MRAALIHMGAPEARFILPFAQTGLYRKSCEKYSSWDQKLCHEPTWNVDLIAASQLHATLTGKGETACRRGNPGPPLPSSADETARLAKPGDAKKKKKEFKEISESLLTTTCSPKEIIKSVHSYRWLKEEVQEPKLETARVKQIPGRTFSNHFQAQDIWSRQEESCHG